MKMRVESLSGEFYQLDFEMAFATQEEVFQTIEPVLHSTFETFGDGAAISPYPFDTLYHDAMLHYGSDKPDLRNPLRIEDLTSFFDKGPFPLFRDAIANQKAVVRCLKASVQGKSRKFFDDLTAAMMSEGAKGLAYVVHQDADPLSFKGPLAKFLKLKRPIFKHHAKLPGRCLFFTAPEAEATKLRRLRTILKRS